MLAIDRVMRAYASKHELSDRQAAFVREELAKIIDEITAAPRRAPVIFPEARDAVDLANAQQSAPKSVGAIEESSYFHT